MSKPVLYVFIASIWAKVPELAIIELGYPADAIEKKSVNLAEAENLSPAFVKISKPSTVPVLVIDGKSYTSTIEVTDWLLEHAPHPVKPGKFQALIDQLHEDSIDPNFPFVGARSKEELEAKKTAFPGTFVRTRYQNVVKFNEVADAEMKEWYKGKLPTLGYLNSLYTDAPAATVDDFVQTSIKHMQRVDKFIAETLATSISESGFIEGAEPGEADFHAAAWLARIALLSGAPTAKEAPAALEKELASNGFKLPEKVAKYIEAWGERSSFKTVYADGLH